MLGKLFPLEHVKRIEDIDFERLLASGYENFFFDYDFTLAPWGELEVDERTVEIFEFLREKGARVFVVTNAKRERVEHLRERLPWVEVHWSVGKPSLKKLRVIMEKKRIDPRKSVIIGDLFLTDVLAGNRLGMYTIMVNPIVWETVKAYKKIVAALSIVLYRTIFFFFGWVFRMGSMISPNEWREGILDIDYDFLIEHGFEVFVFDFDNTLAPWRSTDVPEEHLDLLRDLKKRSLVLIASNGRPRDVDLGVEVIWRSYKPFGFKVKRRLREMGVDFKRVVVIGDQLFTDVLFGNSIGAYTIKVQPISEEEALFTKFNRLLEKIFSKLVVQKPSLKG